MGRNLRNERFWKDDFSEEEYDDAAIFPVPGVRTDRLRAPRRMDNLRLRPYRPKP